MEVNKLQAFVLMIVLVGMVIGIGVLVLDKFGVAVKTPGTVTNESVVVAGGVGTTTNDDVTAITFLGNTTDQALVNVEVNATTTGFVTGTGWQAGTYNVSYTYSKDTPSTTATFAGRDEVSNISTVWLGLIVTIAILAIILLLVIRGYGQR